MGKVGGDSEVSGEGTMRGRDGTERIVQPDEYDATSLNVPGLVLTRPFRCVVRWVRGCRRAG
jgi:hypothetical protein